VVDLEWKRPCFQGGKVSGKGFEGGVGVYGGKKGEWWQYTIPSRETNRGTSKGSVGTLREDGSNWALEGVGRRWSGRLGDERIRKERKGARIGSGSKK